MLQAQAMVDHNAVVYTPCHMYKGSLHTYNFTLPQGMICTDVLPRPGNSLTYTFPAVHLFCRASVSLSRPFLQLCSLLASLLVSMLTDIHVMHEACFSVCVLLSKPYNKAHLELQLQMQALHLMTSSSRHTGHMSSGPLQASSK